MSLIKCPYCGTKYSDSYDECPFCDEEEQQQQPLRANRRPPQQRQQRRGASGRELLSPILVIILVLLLALLGYLLFGGKDSGATDADSDEPAVEETVEPDTMPEIEPEPEPEVVAPDTSVALDLSDFTLNAGETWPIVASGGSGEYTWTSDDATVATVSATGVVSAVGGGNTIITATDGFTSQECIVRVKGTSVSSSTTTTTTTTTTTSGSATLSHSDVTISTGESFGMYVSGTTSSATFSTADSGVATVSAGGTVTGVAKGNTTITATVDSQTLTCVVRVS